MVALVSPKLGGTAANASHLHVVYDPLGGTLFRFECLLFARRRRWRYGPFSSHGNDRIRRSSAFSSASTIVVSPPGQVEWLLNGLEQPSQSSQTRHPKSVAG